MDTKRSVPDDARHALSLFQEGLPIEAILHLYPLSYFDTNTVAVWWAVFEKRRDAICAIERAGLYKAFSRREQIMLGEKKPGVYASTVAALAVTYLHNKAGAPRFGISIREMAAILKVFLSHPTLQKAMRVEAKERHECRVKIENGLRRKQRAPSWTYTSRRVERIVYEFFPESS